MMERLSLKTAIAAALLTTLAGCATTSEHAWQEDTTYKLTVLHTNDNHGRFWQNKYGEYGMAARKTLIDELRADVQAEGGVFYFFLVVILIPVYLSLIYKMQSLILKA